ncbi:MAG: 9-O-acetylesterase [Candidatus Symbiothrix sp.]|jgi:sialate O-acetylesterase|nr:9-O-acetylesterase [Candidatus Symbiothrix sp.]
MKNKHILLISILTQILILRSFSVAGQITLPAMFTDNMVLQQQSEAPIWGKAPANKPVTLSTSWDNKSYTVLADVQGKWKINVSTPVAGGPYSITISNGKKKETVQLENVLIGEVWICSGQSNMEMQVHGIGSVYNYEQEVAAANYPNIRFLSVEHNRSSVPLDDVVVLERGWRVCSPATVANFSAVAYFFGRDIYENQQVPIGLINISYGGTVAEAWTSKESLLTMPDFADEVKALDHFITNEAEQKRIYAEQLIAWNKNIISMDAGFSGQTAWNDSSLDDTQWLNISAPGVVEKNPGMEDFDGLFWVRKEIEIPQSWAGKSLALHLSNIDDIDITYFNGVEVGNTSGWNVEREYTIPAGLVKAGKAVIAVRIMDTGGDGGFGGHSEMYLGLSPKDKIALKGIWKGQKSLPIRNIPPLPRNMSTEANIPTFLFNAMLHPFIPYSLRGALWYQGESNDWRAYQYRELFPLMINDWRKQWNTNFPFYFVQLANYKQRQESPTESDWAELREAQARALHLENTGMAVTIDIGDAADIHPRNKQDVGKRLALIARANIYGENIGYSGPVYDTYKIEGNKIRIRFKHTEGGLKAKDNEMLSGFAIAGVNRKFYWAEAEIEGDEIIISSPDVDFPVAVRYAWADNPLCNLYNGIGLPASPFRTDDWAGVTFNNH